MTYVHHLNCATKTKNNNNNELSCKLKGVSKVFKK